MGIQKLLTGNYLKESSSLIILLFYSSMFPIQEWYHNYKCNNTLKDKIMKDTVKTNTYLQEKFEWKFTLDY